MTPAEAAIREALAAGPTDGPWHAPGLGEVMDATSRCIGCHIDVDPVDEVERPVPDHDEGERIARYVAACNPVAIRTLLSELDALRARCEAREALLIEASNRLEELGKGGHICDAIDAHLKGAGRE